MTTKAEELKVLSQIEKLIASAGDDSYIAMTFKGIVDVCRDNIANDFGDCPVEDLKHARETNEKHYKRIQELSEAEASARAQYVELQREYRAAIEALTAARPALVEVASIAKDEVASLTSKSSDVDIVSAVRHQLENAEAREKVTAVLIDSKKIIENF